MCLPVHAKHLVRVPIPQSTAVSSVWTQRLFHFPTFVLFCGIAWSHGWSLRLGRLFILVLKNPFPSTQLDSRTLILGLVRWDMVSANLLSRRRSLSIFFESYTRPTWLLMVVVMGEIGARLN